LAQKQQIVEWSLHPFASTSDGARETHASTTPNERTTSARVGGSALAASDAVVDGCDAGARRSGVQRNLAPTDGHLPAAFGRDCNGSAVAGQHRLETTVPTTMIGAA